MTTKILVIEDDPDIREFVSIALKLGFSDSHMLSTHLGNEGIEIVKNENPDIVLLDLELPDISGFEVLREIRAFSNVPIIIETVRDTEADTVRGLTLGADDYIGKPYSQLELLARIKAVLKRTAKDNSSKLSFRDMHLDISRRTLSQGSALVRLTPTETLIIEALMKSDTQRQTFDELAHVIWGTDYSGANDTIRVYIRRLRSKVESVTNGTVSINYKRGTGFILDYCEVTTKLFAKT